MQTIKLNGKREVAGLSIEKSVSIPNLTPLIADIEIVGVTPLIVHNWSQKAIKMMLDKQTGEPKTQREKKKPIEDFIGSLYPIDGGKMFGLPAPAFKAAAVTAANSVELKMTQMRQAFHVTCYTVPIIGKPITTPITPEDEKYKKELVKYHALGISMRMDVVRLETGVADLRFRGWYPEWSARLRVEYFENMITLAQLVNLIRAGGMLCGVGEWRPSSPKCRSGEFGRFNVKMK